jgi:hypothetical protein
VIESANCIPNPRAIKKKPGSGELGIRIVHGEGTKLMKFQYFLPEMIKFYNTPEASKVASQLRIKQETTSVFLPTHSSRSKKTREHTFQLLNHDGHDWAYNCHCTFGIFE